MGQGTIGYRCSSWKDLSYMLQQVQKYSQLKLQTVLNCFVLCGLISTVQSTRLDLVAMKKNNNSDTGRGSHLNTSCIHGSRTDHLCINLCDKTNLVLYYSC